MTAVPITAVWNVIPPPAICRCSSVGDQQQKRRKRTAKIAVQVIHCWNKLKSRPSVAVELHSEFMDLRFPRVCRPLSKKHLLVESIFTQVLEYKFKLPVLYWNIKIQWKIKLVVPNLFDFWPLKKTMSSWGSDIMIQISLDIYIQISIDVRSSTKETSPL